MMQMPVLDVKDKWLFQGEDAQMHEKKQETFKNNPTAEWKITLWPWQINCRMKVLMGNKDSKNSYSSLEQDQTRRLLNVWVIVQPGSGSSSTDNAAIPEIDESKNTSSFSPEMERTSASTPCQSATKQL